MIEPVCIKNKNYGDKFYICNEAYIKQQSELIVEGNYNVVSNDIISNMKDLIVYCLSYNYEIDIPEEYNVLTLYNISFNTGNFEPKDREHSFCRNSIIYTSTELNETEEMFKRMCSIIGRKPIFEDKRTFCWQTEDFAVNQIIHSYSISESYLVDDRNGVKEDYKNKIIEMIKDIHGFCRKDVLEDLLKQIRSL